MNLTARIKGAKHKPNYILNVNINIPIRHSQLQSQRPVQGEFTFSPSQLKKRLKLEIPSARTTYECDSRKLSYLAETQNTMSLRMNRKKNTKSAMPSEQGTSLANVSKKSKSQIRSEVVSPSRKRSASKITKSQKNIKSNQFVNNIIDETDDNIMGYTNPSSELSRLDKVNLSNVQLTRTIKLTNPSYLARTETPPIPEDERSIVEQIREYEKSAQFKKQHVNYLELKEKILVLASVKKIQRAWRNYKTKKLVKSYSNNIALKFTGKMRSSLLEGAVDENKILTVRSCGFNGRSNQMRKFGKKNLSTFVPAPQEQVDFNKESKKDSGSGKNKKNKSNSKSAIVKFQMQQIQRWQQLIKNIRQGKKVDEVLEKSFKRKEQLQRQLKQNLNQIAASNNSGSSNQFQAITQYKQDVAKPQEIRVQTPPDQGSLSSSNSNICKINEPQQPSGTLRRENKMPINQQLQILFQKTQSEDEYEIVESDIEQAEVQQGLTTQRRRRKLQYFENQLRKIDNQASEQDLEQSQYQYESPQSPQVIIPEDQRSFRETEQEENLKLKKKLEAINRIQLYDTLYKEINEQEQVEQFKQPQVPQKNYPERVTGQTVINQKAIEKDFFPLSLNRRNVQQREQKQQGDKLNTFRNKNSEQRRVPCKEDQQLLRWRKYRNRKLSRDQKQQIYERLEQQLFYDFLLELSDKEGFIQRIQKLYVRNTLLKKAAEDSKPEGICTNLESIKDYLQNFVAFAFQQMPSKLIQGFNNPRGPSTMSLLRYLNQISNKKEQQPNFHVPVLSLQLFNQHWFYASEQIYFDAKYQDDPAKEKQRVNYLKQITKVYFRAIFDGFNQSLQPYRVYGLRGKPLLWQPNIRSNSPILQLKQIKPLIRLGYRKLSQLAIVYCGLLFQDKKHNMPTKTIEEIQKQRLETLIEIELHDEEHKWLSRGVEEAGVAWRLHKIVEEMLLTEVCLELRMFSQGC